MRQADGMSTRRETLEVAALLADLDGARETFEAAERRARTYLVRRGIIDQTDRDLPSLLRECVRTARD
jgi:alkanesulfonate monooxygenase SsuD/methylene tetrahydromethanopterin reductase-like flavin-dependent oxidoreductase (luciferase family)